MSGLISVDAPIAIFDSGLGGLSVARHIRRRLPQESLLYFADCAWAPYGDRTPDVILKRVCVVAEWLVAQQVKALVIACNTSTTIAIETLRARFSELPIVGVEPGVKPAVAASRSRVVGVLATAATLGTESFRSLLVRQGTLCRFVCQAGHGLVALIEQGALDTSAIDVLLLKYLDAMLVEGVDTLVLGSTHFPLLVPAIRRLYGDRFALVDTGPAVAQRLQAVLAERMLEAQAERMLEPQAERGVEGEIARQYAPGIYSAHLPLAGDSVNGKVRLVSSRQSPALLALAGQCVGVTSGLEIALEHSCA